MNYQVVNLLTNYIGDRKTIGSYTPTIHHPIQYLYLILTAEEFWLFILLRIYRIVNFII